MLKDIRMHFFYYTNEIRKWDIFITFKYLHFTTVSNKYKRFIKCIQLNINTLLDCDRRSVFL